MSKKTAALSAETPVLASFDLNSGRFLVGSEPIRVLVVDDDDPLRRAHQRIIARTGAQVTDVDNAKAVLTLLSCGARFDVIVTDIVMPNMDGLAMLREIRRYDLDVPVILVTGNPSLSSAMKAMRYGGFRYLTKPVEAAELCEVIREAAHLHRLARLKREALELAETCHAQLGDQASLEVRFERALECLWVAFQPIVDWSRRTLHGYEALVRSDEVTLRSPQLIFDAAERLGRVSEVGSRVRDLVAAAIPAAPEEAVLFVNLHPMDLRDTHLYDPEAALSAVSRRVVLEVTERSSLWAIDDVSGLMTRLRELGYRIAVDDLGAGYAGLASFSQLEPEVVKLDLSLVRGIDQSTHKQSLVRAMIALCERELDMRVVCEGIETPAERDTLDSLGASLLQGFLFGRPDPQFLPPSVEPSLLPVSG